MYIKERPRKTLAKRLIKRRNRRMLRGRKSSVSLLQESDTQTPIITKATVATEAFPRGIMLDKGVQCPCRLRVTISTQTNHNPLCDSSTQTDLPPMLTSCFVQTLQMKCASVYTQTQKSLNHVCTQTDEDIDSERVLGEREAMILMLNEIGEMILNQNYLLHNNSTLLTQISEMSVLTRNVKDSNTTLKFCQKMETQRRARAYNMRRGKNRCLFVVKKRYKAPMSDCETQVNFVVENAQKSTQTGRSIGKSNRIFGLFRSSSTSPCPEIA